MTHQGEGATVPEVERAFRAIFTASAVFVAAMVGLFVAIFVDFGHPDPAPKSATVKVFMASGHGSGVHIGNGFVLTAAHVANNSSAEKPLRIKAETGEEQQATVLWVNASYDVALLRVDDTSKLGASQLSCSPVERGAAIRAEGNPGDIEFVHTWGHVSGVSRARLPWYQAIVTDITIVPGMSGGPIYDDRDRVIGLSIGVMLSPSGYSMSMVGITYAVPGPTICSLLARGEA